MEAGGCCSDHTPKKSSSALDPDGLRKMIDSEAAALADMLLLLLGDAAGAGIQIQRLPAADTLPPLIV